LLHLLGRNEEALTEMKKALTFCEKEKREYLRDQLNRLDERQFERKLQMLNEDLAVMYYHRGLIHQQMERRQEADEDLSKAKELGYDPTKGVL
jgi:tetratricopeptide (TPR) repeat protein